MYDVFQKRKYSKKNVFKRYFVSIELIQFQMKKINFSTQTFSRMFYDLQITNINCTILIKIIQLWGILNPLGLIIC